MTWNNPINYFSLIGLIADFIGVLLLLKYGLPSKLITARGPSLLGEFTKKQTEEIEKHNKPILL